LVSFKKKKILKLNSKNIYFLVADVKKYPDFLPWCKGIVVKKKTKKYILTEVKIGFKNITESYICKVLLFPYKRITLEYISGPFEYLEIDWNFKKISDNKTEIDFFCNFKFKSIFLRLCTNFFLENAVEQMVNAFEKKLNN
jgi:coenzyme Q-binding protein COQ10